MSELKFDDICRAWITIDNQLFLWDYLHPQDFIVFKDFSEVIISVALSIPKAGVFTNAVKYILIVATPIEVKLLALVWDTDLTQLKIQSTAYTIPSDNITMFKVIGSQSGRIFMGGNDGNIYELDYQNLDTNWSVLGPSKKCRKFNHSAWHWKLLHLVPPFLREIAGWNDSLVDLVVDDVRKLLYSITSRGEMTVFYLGEDAKSMTAIATHYNIFQEAYNCISSSPKESSPKADYFKSSAMKVVGLFVIPVTESRQLHLVIVMSSGIRVYLSVRAVDGYHYFREGSSSPPTAIRVEYVRSPPPTEATAAALKTVTSRETAYSPTYLPSQPLNAHTAYYCHGVLLSAIGDESSSDKLIGLSEDLTIRVATISGGSSVSVPSFRESLTVIAHESSDSKVYDIKEAPLAFSADALTLRTAYVASKTPPTYPVTADQRYTATPSENLYPGFSSAINTSVGRGLGGQLSNAVQPLSEFSVQMAPSITKSKRLFLCLLNTGIVLMHKNRPIDILYRILETNCNGDEYLEPARYFFNCFGVLQSCSMCFSIACGLPADISGDVPEEKLSISSTDLSLVQRRALTAMQRLGEPSSYKHSATAPIMQDSRLNITGGTGFTFSSIHDSMQLFFSRVVRPLWIKGVVARGKISQFFASRKILAAMRIPITFLRGLLLNYFSSVVKMDVLDFKKDDSSSVGSLLLRQIQLQSKVQEDQEKILQRESRRKEESSIHALFRLVSRSAQALSLIDILIAAEAEMKISVAWSRLDGLTLQYFVCSMEAHEKIQKLLDHTLEQISASKLGMTACDRLTDLLSTHCFLFFSAGDRYRYEAFKLISELNTTMKSGSGTFIPGQNSIDVDTIASKAISLLLKASKYWRSLDDVTPSMVGGSITFSTLKKCCLELATLGVTGRDAIVDICISTAGNFSDAQAVMTAGSGVYAVDINDDWERELYHGLGVSSSEDRLSGRRACYQCLLEEIRSIHVSHLKGIGAGVVSDIAASSVVSVEEQEKVTLRMIERAIGASRDNLFLEMLCESLFDWNKSLLMRLRGHGIETFLMRKDSMTLFNYFSSHRRSLDACNLAAKLALSDSDMDISERIHYFTLAVTSITAMGVEDDHSGRVIELQDRLIIAEFQRAAYNALNAELEAINSANANYDAQQRRGIDALANLVKSLRYRLKSISELYLEVTEPYKLWDLSLQLLFAAKSEDYSLVVRLWRSLIYRIVPDRSDVFEVGLFIQAKRSSQVIDIDVRKQRNDVLYENYSTWLNDMIEKVISVGKTVRGGESEIAFPTEVIVEELEEIILQLHMLDIPLERNLASHAFLRIGLNHERILAAYMSILKRWEARNAQAVVSLAQGACGTLVDWIGRSSG